VRSLVAAVVLLASASAGADQPRPDDNPRPGPLLPRWGDSRLFVAGQANVIFQYHPAFAAKYSGENSLKPESENATSVLLTLFSGLRITATSEAIFDVELAVGGGLSTALGLGGFTNLDVVRNPTLGSTPYIARAFLRQVIPLSRDYDPLERGPLSVFTRLPRHRLELRVGKFSTADFFDVNGVASDSHLQFMNWAIDANGAYDYAADTRGYSYGAMIEYAGPRVQVRFAEMTMPKVANGIDLDLDLTRARGENLEVDGLYLARSGFYGIVRVLGFLNHADMGNYDEALAMPGVPDITATRRQGRLKGGIILNAEQQLFGMLRLFLRGGWNDGQNETFAYTEVDDDFAFGFDLFGRVWRRPGDQLGGAIVTNGLSGPHRQYLARGGKGFILGDGALNYGRELIFETYYTLHLWRGMYVAGDLQAIGNPGYNRDRGPVVVLSARAHVDF
jgi:hypothetical protein